MQRCTAMSTRGQTVQEQQEAIREKVRRIVKATNWSYSYIAKKAGLGAASTLTRFMNNPDITHVLSTKTLAKIESLGNYLPAQKDDPALLKALGDRMRFVRETMAPAHSDDAVAGPIGWSAEEMKSIFEGKAAPTVTALQMFAARMRVTTDFLLSESLEGLPRFAEARLLAARPTLGEPPADNEPHTGTDQA